MDGEVGAAAGGAVGAVADLGTVTKVDGGLATGALGAGAPEGGAAVTKTPPGLADDGKTGTIGMTLVDEGRDTYIDEDAAGGAGLGGAAVTLGAAGAAVGLEPEPGAGATALPQALPVGGWS